MGSTKLATISRHATRIAARPIPPADDFTPDCTAHFVATYHYVREHNSDGVTGLTPDAFAEQVRAIAARYRVVSADEFVSTHRDQPGLALITFDDALRDQWIAAAILDDLGLPGVFYAPMRPYCEEANTWCAQHLLHALAERLGWTALERLAAPYLAEVAIDQAEVDRLYAYEVPHKRRLKYALAFAVSPERAAEILHQLNARIGLRSTDWYLTAGQLRDLQAGGHALGGHGFDHVPYSTLSREALSTDISRAALTMNTLFGKCPRTIAYPFGRFTPETEMLARQSGYCLGFSTANRIDAKDVTTELARRTSRNHP